MGSYTHEITVPASKERILRWLSDPFLLSGVFGHVSILQVFDPKSQKYVTPSSLSGYSTKFKVIYIFGTPESKVYTNIGEMKGPLYTPSGIAYEGNTSDGKLKWNINFEVRSVRTLESLVRISVISEYEISAFDRFFGKTPFALPEHIVKDHIVPYVKYYFKPSDASQLDITPTVVYSDEGSLSDIIAKVLKGISEVHYGVITIEGEGVNGKILIKNGRIERINVNYNESLISGQDALLQLLSIPNTAKVTLYSLDLDNAVMAMLERVQSKKTVNNTAPM
ncbi:hypothetical protein [Stygiolobus caldivivus]|uniref:Uncharacterized protein n=1 Tax=Stygiolobus caldivivus TaxID=2824673 RepID=A0A8D5ZCX8_9CREN|nr:hypothetical protein [Stygiolobus caldivivus]BCU68803.1 hypothetical protein KN1_01000 [Stygiolobus caldivivus]